MADIHRIAEMVVGAARARACARRVAARRLLKDHDLTRLAVPTTLPLPASIPGHRWREPGRLEPGQIVRVRSRQYLVEDLSPPKQHGDATLVRLSCLEDDALGEPLEVLWECEVDARVLGKSSWEAVAERGFDRPELFSAYLHTLRWGCVTSTNPRLFQAPYRAGIQVKDYQLAPLRKALQMPPARPTTTTAPPS